jgi:hypothetical protein
MANLLEYKRYPVFLNSGVLMAGFLKNLKKFFSEPSSSGTANFINFYVKCDRCGEEITVKARKSSDLSRVYEDEGEPSGAAFFLRKEILGNKCSNLMHLSAYFGESLNLLSKEITGGKFIE